MPQLDDPDVGVVDAVDDRLVVVDDDDVGAGEQPRQADPIGEAPPLGDAGLEQRQQLVLAVQAALDHLVVHDLEVAAELRARVGAEQDPPAVAARDRPKQPEQHAEQADAEDPEGAQDPVQPASARPCRPARSPGSERVTCSDIEPSPGSTDGTARNSPRSSVKAPASRAGSTDSGSAMTTGSPRRQRCRYGRGAIGPAPGDLAGALHHVEAQSDVVALAGRVGRGHLQQPGPVGRGILVAEPVRRRVRGGGAGRGAVPGPRRTSLDHPLHTLPRERQQVDARHVEAGVLSGRMRQWPFLSAGDDTRRRPRRPPTATGRATAGTTGARP